MVGFSHAINNLEPSQNIKQEELLLDPDLSIPLVNSSIPDFDFIDEWLKETDSMDTDVPLHINETDSMDTEVPLHINETANGGKPIEVKPELLSSTDIPLVQETCKESTGLDSSIEIALEKVSLVGTSEGSDIIDISSEAVVTSGSGDCVPSEGGDGVSLVDDDPTKSHKNVDQGGKETTVIVKETDSMDTEVPLHINETANGGKPIEVKTELLSSTDIPLVQETCKESTGVDMSIEIALEKVSLVGTSEVSDIVDVSSEAVVTSGSGDSLLNLMASEGGDGVSLVDDDPTKSHKNVDQGGKETTVIIKDSKDDVDSSESESESEEESEEESEDESSSSSESSDEEEEDEEMMGDLEEGEMKELEELIGESDGDEEGFSVKGPIKSKNEVQELPPVPKVDVTLEPHHQTLPVGVVLTIMDAKVIVEGVEKHNPLNEGSILWITENRSVLGLVDEVFGPVKNPYYIVRYNSKEEVPAEISQGTLISFVAEFADHVLNDKNIYKKGYDASGENDEELTDEAEFSDDEKEAEYKRMQRISKRGPSDDKKHGNRDFVDKKKFQQKPRNVNNNRTSFTPSNVPPHQIHGGSSSSPSHFGTGMTNNFRPPFGSFTSQAPQAHSGPTPQQHPLRPSMGPASQQHPPRPSMGPASQQHPPPFNMGPASQQHPLPSNMGPASQQHPPPSNMGVAQQQHTLPPNVAWPNGQPYQQNVGFPNGFPSMGPASQQQYQQNVGFANGFPNMGPALQQHPLPSNMGVAQQQHTLPPNVAWPNGQPYQQNVGFPNGFPMNAMSYVPYQQPQHSYQPQMFTGFSSVPPQPQHFDPSQRPILGPMPYGPSNISPGMPPAMPMFMGQPGFNQGPIMMGFQGYPPRPHMNPGEQGVPFQGSPNETHVNVGEQGAQSQGQGPLNEQNNGVQPSSTQGNFSAQNRFSNRGAARGRRPYQRGGGRGRH